MALRPLMVLIEEGSSMKKLAVLSLVCLLATFILLPLTTNGKYNLSKPTAADGYPLPPPIPPSSVTTDTLVADGYPLPPPIPPSTSARTDTDTLVADGYPLPPPIPPSANIGLYSA